MKNFKLLLATTAILSAGLVICANAENPKTQMPARVTIISPTSFDMSDDMDFGTWIVPDNTETVILSMDSNGYVTANDSKIEEFGDLSHPGMVIGAPCESLSFPDSFDLVGSDNLNTATLSGIAAVQEDVVDLSCRVYATKLEISNANGIKSEYMTGTFVITAMLGLE